MCEYCGHCNNPGFQTRLDTCPHESRSLVRNLFDHQNRSFWSRPVQIPLWPPPFCKVCTTCWLRSPQIDCPGRVRSMETATGTIRNCICAILGDDILTNVLTKWVGYLAKNWHDRQ